MKHKLQTCICGGSLSCLRRYCRDEFFTYLMNHNLLKSQEGYAHSVIVRGEPLDVRYNEETAEYRAEGTIRGVWVDRKIPASKAILYKLSLKDFLKEALCLDMFNVQLHHLAPLRSGCGAFRICDLPEFNVTLYLSLTNSNTEFSLIEQNCKHFSRGVVIICPENDPPAEYRSVVGNCQIIALDDLFAEGDELDMAPMTVYLRSNGGTQTPPYTVMPSLEPGQVSWEDIGLHFREDHKLDILIKSKKKTFLREHVYFTRMAVNTTDNEIQQTNLLLALAHIKEWNTLGGQRKKALERLSKEMQVFFRQPSPFYAKGKDGLNRLKPLISVDPALSESFQESVAELRNELESSGLRKVQSGSGITDWDAFKSVTNKLRRR